MRLLTTLAVVAATAATMLVTETASATNRTLWVHGRNTGSGSGCSGGTPNGWDYWAGTAAVGVNSIPVNYDGRAYNSVSNPTVRKALSTNCKGSDVCYIAAHSNGGAQIGYAIDKFNNAAACSGGDASLCGPWNIQWVATAGSAAGGTGLSSWGSWAMGDCLAGELQPGTIRGEYNHDSVGNQIYGYVYTHVGGDWETLTNAFISGNNDGVIGYDSSGHSRSSGSYDNGSIGGASKWNYTIAQFVDPNDCYTNSWFGCLSHSGHRRHYVSASSDVQGWGGYESWGGVVGAMNSFVNANAR